MADGIAASALKSRYHSGLFAYLAMDTMTENDYLIAWGLYAFAALGCLLVWFAMTRWMWRWLREPLRLLVAVLLFSPTIVDPVKTQFAPAVAITALDLVLKVGNNAWRAISDLFMYCMIAFGVYLVFVLIRWPIERAARVRREQKAASAAAAAAEREDDDEPFADERYGRPAPVSGMRVEPRL
ncbi:MULTISPECIES: MFS transporter [unclassified Pseudomonas]|uniref:MFS transporter n=1 Tax=unclassified Pseudomonas TaxID=196821 RepID=UPI00106746CF|nr:MFS transporter [Pseudomonas sp. SXM-1]QBQ09636.1 MFS transporter [Pseudomonas sp. SXM-1]